MKVLITGVNGFVGKNVVAHLHERQDIQVVGFGREHASSDLLSMLEDVDFVFHLAGVNRPQRVEEFSEGNSGLTSALCAAIKATGRSIPVIYTSSIQAEVDNPYGTSKRDAEHALIELSEQQGSPVYLYRLPNVFGKWARPDYNSAVATFCHNIVRDLPITINNPAAPLQLVYIDDVVKSFIEVMDGNVAKGPYLDVQPVYDTTVGALADQLQAFKRSRETMVIERVGTGLVRALYSTYLSYFPPEVFTYELPKHGDARGVFVEMLKTPDAGQFSYFTAHPGITRGGHYHHSKTEKFLVIKGHACFRFRHIVSGEFYELYTDGDTPQVVETVPGWTHDITNTGETEMIVMLWANEIFDRERPDTYTMAVGTRA
ncbi:MULTISPECIES: UDP-2-acetamido-2,6-beta-L-arabino-hexul-4-ose reductase [Pseudomonas]|uniref:UDP-2-acetamido-2,6-beta-L-arabino-hexul-4-ose reductase n=1 Tax=Pseudomonas TaxID=286 RepID=UPI001BE96BEB|nr:MULTISPECIES: NAD-dependent epimerase/dehydratase family protein [Pseudomonas]MBT2342230.1 NAD-dependent epimerase/dehydratase family protein [Pseudomonas fluorescens]MCD4529005.1 NAD-dependent epimerase/dehydratase family protein [Pseudomonas sp. C3-2018]